VENLIPPAGRMASDAMSPAYRKPVQQSERCLPNF
jgi:hypothetical protein